MPRLVYPHPRDWLPTNQRDGFGRRTSLDLPTPRTPLERSLIEAAKRQHNLARGIRNYRDSAGRTTADIAAYAGLSAPAVRGILNGSRHATLAALYALASAVDRDLTVGFGSTENQSR